MDIEKLNIAISSNSEEVSNAIDKLTSTLGKLKSATSGLTGLNKVSGFLDKISASAKGLNSLGNVSSKLMSLTSALQQINSLGKNNINPFLNSLKKMPEIVNSINSMPDINTSKINALVTAVKPFETMGKNNINPFLNSIKKLPELSKSLDSIDMDKFASSIARVTTAIKPLASEMNKVSSGFSALPTKLQRVIYGLDKSSASAKNANKSFGNLFSGFAGGSIKITAVYYILKKVGSVLGSFVSEGNDYIENLNLFEVAMGSGAKSALAYAEAVNKALGIDVSEFIRNQGVFKQVTSGFGVVEDKANLMSKNLTTLGYDISSFFNIGIEDAMQKTQSGISGEIEPLRRLGYALDQATLQQVAYENGIKQKLSTMTQAQKSQLRYIAIMQQSTNVMGDMARTVLTPSNAMRILEQQITQLKRAIGNILIPVLIKVIPYVQAFIRVLTEAAQKIANLMGFKLPTIDYSNVGKLGTVSDDLDGIADSAKDTAKALKPLAGFDELNILSFSSGSAGAEASGLGNYDLGLELPEYDFLGDVDKQADGIYRKVKDWLKKIFPIAKNIAIAIAAIWTIGKITKFISTIAKVVTAIKKLAIIKGISKLFTGFMTSFNFAFENGAGIFKSLSAGVGGLRSALSPLAKVLIGVAGAVATFLVYKNVFQDATTGTKSWSDALKILIPVTIAIGAAMYVALGPIGLVITAVAALAGAMAGYSAGTEEILDKKIADMWENDGIKISEVAESIGNLTTKMTETETAYLNNIENLKGIQQNAMGVSDELSVMIADISGAGDISETEIGKIKTAFGDLANASKQYIQDSNNSMKLYLIANKEMLEAQGISSQTLVDIINEGTDNSISKIDEIQARIDELTNKSSMSDIEITELSALQEELLKMSGIEIDTSEIDKLKDSVKAFSEVEFSLESPEQLSEAWTTISSSLAQAESNLATTRDELFKTISTMEVPEDKKKELRDSVTSLFDLKESDLQAAVAPTIQKIKRTTESLVASSDAAVSEYLGKNSFNPWVTLRYGADFDVAFEKLSNEKVPAWMRSLDTSMKSEAAKYGVDSSTIDKYFNYDANKIQQTATSASEEFTSGVSTALIDRRSEWEIQATEIFGGLGADIPKYYANGIIGNKQVIDPALNDFYKEMQRSMTNQTFEIPAPNLSSWSSAGTNAALAGIAIAKGKQLQEGTAQGISLNSNLPINAIVQSAKDTNTAYENMQGIHSPSKVYEGYGMFQMQGLSNGVKLGVPIVLSTISSITSRINTSFSSSLPNLKNSGIQLMQSFTDGINQSSVTLTDSFNVILDKLQLFINNFKVGFNGLSLALAGANIKTGIQANIVVPKMYANGGFPAQGEMFIANEAGPELVGRIGSRTAVANDSQITSSIERAVYRAMVSANAGNQNDRPIHLDATFDVDGREVGRVAVKYQNGQQIKSNSK